MDNVSELICEKLQSTDRKIRASGLDELLKIIASNGKTNSTDVIISIFDQCYLYILKCYEDKYENCRESSVEVVDEFINLLPPNDFYFQNIILTISARIGGSETLESSEEIRYMYVCQINSLIKKYNLVGKVEEIKLLYDDVTKILIKRARDNFPAVQKEVCSTVVNLTKSADYRFWSYAEQLAKAIFPLLNHKHSQNRIAAIETLGCLALHVDPKNEILHRIFTEISPLLMDSMPLVRRECGRVGCHLLLELRDRYSYFDRITPLVLSCLKDDSAEVRNFIQPLWNKCGELYYEENEAELSKEEISDIPPENYPVDVVRPTIGCRGLVQRGLRLVKLIVRESSDWKDNVRLHSLKLLYQFVLHAESAMTAKFFEIYPDVAKACRDSETDVALEAIKVADLMGRVLCYNDWKDHAIDGLNKNLKEGYLKCFCHMYLAAGKNSANFEDISKVLEVLIQPELSQCLNAKVQEYVLKLIEGIWEKVLKESLLTKDPTSNFANDLLQKSYATTIKIIALSFEKNNDEENFYKKGNLILTKMAKSQDMDIDKLHEVYFEYTLKFVTNLDANLDGLCEPILLLYGMIRICKFRAVYMTVLTSNIKQVWDNGSDDAKVKIFSAISVAMLSWHETIGRDTEESTKLLKIFLDEVIIEYLTWRAGAKSECMRTLAAATLCSIAEGAEDEARIVLPATAKHFPNLIEDHCVSTRRYALKSLLGFGKLNVNELKAIGYAVLQRLDDPSADVRELVAVVIPTLTPDYDESANNYNLSIWHTFINKTFEMFFLHFEGPETKLKVVLKDSLVILGKKYPEVFKESFVRAVSFSTNKTELQEIFDIISNKTSN